MSNCPLCSRAEGALIYELAGPDADLVELLQANLPGWESAAGVCPNCLELLRGAQQRFLANPAIFSDGAYRILPTPLRMGADERFTGRGVTIAFLDSGFFFHPDLTATQNRIKRYVNVALTGEHAERNPLNNADEGWDELKRSDDSSWHGMMTSVVAAGNGYLSQGLYRGIASEANVVLLKVGTANRITHEDIRRGLEWVLRNKDAYNIRVVNVSCAGDYEASYLTDGLSQAAEACVRAGLVVCCAAGNAGHSPHHEVLPPASAPAVITVGGFNDKNTLVLADNEVYQSSYGPTLDGLQKPELIAPSIWLAAPILPDTPTAEAAHLYHELHAAPDSQLREILNEHAGIDSDLDAARALPHYLIRQLVAIKLHDNNVISGQYKHVDGTSFASPIVASVVAQMLQANARLTPQQVKRILIDTAIRLENVPVERQGWGSIIPGRAVARALEMRRSR
ncbi:MAG: S8 family serine peptidase [Acidobacteria bacterium]|nr:S8 family serine peptidase [Acidobacteriota bacterium]MBI3424985.1 S8 family serine peptidase [Acidobacteriota bacterium]